MSEPLFSTLPGKSSSHYSIMPVVLLKFERTLCRRLSLTSGTNKSFAALCTSRTDNFLFADCTKVVPQCRCAKQNIPQCAQIHIPNNLSELCILVHNSIHDMSHQDTHRPIIFQVQLESCHVRTQIPLICQTKIIVQLFCRRLSKCFLSCEWKRGLLLLRKSGTTCIV